MTSGRRHQSAGGGRSPAGRRDDPFPPVSDLPRAQQRGSGRSCLARLHDPLSHATPDAPAHHSPAPGRGPSAPHRHQPRARGSRTAGQPLRGRYRAQGLHVSAGAQVLHHHPVPPVRGCPRRAQPSPASSCSGRPARTATRGGRRRRELTPTERFADRMPEPGFSSRLARGFRSCGSWWGPAGASGSAQLRGGRRPGRCRHGRPRRHRAARARHRRTARGRDRSSHPSLPRAEQG